MSFQVTVKWGKEVFVTTLDTTAAPSVFKEAIYQKTGVPVDRQKLMAPKGWAGTLKDEFKWKKGSCQLKDGSKINLVGTSTGIPAPPKTSVVFVEDMDSAITITALPPGLVNLGNTCYMNATVQALNSVPELRESLIKYGGGSAMDLPGLLAKVFIKMRHTSDPLNQEINMFWQHLQATFPQYAERSPQTGVHKQQDADEFYTNLLQTLNRVPATPEILGESAGADAGEKPDVASALFGLTMETTMSCQETDAEEPSVRKEKMFKLICNISGGEGASTQVNHLAQGLQLGLEGQVEKQSELLGRNALYKKTSKIDRLPRYLVVQYMRFFWKETPDSRDHEGVRCKILRRVKFADNLDVYQFCSDRLKAELKVQRDLDAADVYAKDEAKKKEAEKSQGGASKEAKKPKTKKKATSKPTTGPPVLAGPSAKTMKLLAQYAGKGPEQSKDASKQVVDKDEEQVRKKSKVEEEPSAPAAQADADGSAVEPVGEEQTPEEKALQEALRMSMGGLVEEVAATKAGARTVAKGADIGIGLPDNFRGNYQLHAIVTHKGRSANGGHYMGWARQENAEEDEEWICFDDDQVDPCGLHNVLDLNGGGDRDMAYLCFYRFKN